ADNRDLHSFPTRRSSDLYLWVSDELKVDKYNKNDERIYQVMTNVRTGDGIKTATYTPGLLGQALGQDIPEIEYAVSILPASWFRSEEHTSELQSRENLVC